MNRSLLRAVGAATAGYGLAVAARPAVLARPSGLSGADGTVPRSVGTCPRPLGLRDAVCGLAMACAPDDRSLRTASLLRIAADFGDAALLTGTLPGRRHRAMALGDGAGRVGRLGLLSVAGLAAVPAAARARPRRHGGTPGRGPTPVRRAARAADGPPRGGR
ncbi:hypothetical protein ACFVHB_15460 [Kitasatospora sp. NPDC127111]|uniref:hypothetical protein n=1 Tax=Kitasatospora sp. NPDC127111 TaxID=3345363 RepID=UPI00362B3A0F